MLSEPFSGLRNPPNINYFQRHIGQSQVKTRYRKSLIDIRHSCDGFCTEIIANTDNIYIFSHENRMCAGNKIVFAANRK